MRSWSAHLVVVYCLTLMNTSHLVAQDVHYSQYYAQPLYLNPALTGAHGGTYRIFSAYRSQWAGVLDQPFNATIAGGDIRFTIRNARGSYSGGNDVAAAGVQFYSDRVGQIDYNTNHISLFGAYHKLLSAKSNAYLSGGLQLGLGQRGINYEDLNFADEFNGVNQYNLGTSEQLPANALGYSDLSMGLHLSIFPKEDKGFYLGVAFHHFNEPNISFFNRDIKFEDLYTPFTLSPKLTVHAGASILRSDVLAVQPRAIFIKQGAASTIVVGTNLKYNMLDTQDIALHIGGWLRASDNITTYQPTDLILSTAFQKGGLQIGFSYDHHLRHLSGSILGQGIFELSIQYTGQHDSEYQICPSF